MPKDRKSHTLSSYKAMLNRCNNPKNPDYCRYGGRGISICDRWFGPAGFLHFCIDMGLRPVGKSIDRIDNNGDYCPSNCKWSSPKEQSRNMRSNHYLLYNGEKISLIEASERLQISPETVRTRITRGMSPVEALLAPVHSDDPRERNKLCQSVQLESYRG